MYQAADLASLGLIVELLRQFRNPKIRETYQEEYDTMDVSLAWEGERVASAQLYCRFRSHRCSMSCCTSLS